MIQPLRTVHRHAFIALAAFLPIILAAALIARHQFANVRPAVFSIPQNAIRLNQASATWNKNTFDTEFYSEPRNPSGVLAVLKTRRNLDAPDLLLYWSEADANSPDLNAARLLGTFVAGKSYRLPASDGGTLVLYSLAHGEIVDSARIAAGIHNRIALRPFWWGVFLFCACSDRRDPCENTGCSLECIRAVDEKLCLFCADKREVVRS